MVIQFVSGGGAINAITRENNQTLKVIDMGVDHDFSLATGVIDAKVRRGTRNFSTESAMTVEECQLAIERGRGLLSGSTPSIIGVGEMGIGNPPPPGHRLCPVEPVCIRSCGDWNC